MKIQFCLFPKLLKWFHIFLQMKIRSRTIDKQGAKERTLVTVAWCNVGCSHLWLGATLDAVICGWLGGLLN